MFNKKCVNLATKEHEMSRKNAKEERKATYNCKRKSDNINRTSSNNSNIVNFGRSNNHDDIRPEWIVYKS